MAANGTDFVKQFLRQYSHEDLDHKGDLPYKQFQRAVLNFQLEDYMSVKSHVDALVGKYKENWERGLGSESLLEDTFMRSSLRNCIFVGHVNTDLDSIAGALGAAELFRGFACRSEEGMNGEIEHALKFAEMEAPPMFEEFPGGAQPDEKGKLKKVCLVDHNEVDQMTPALKYDPQRMKRVAGLIDHHAVASSFSSSAPLFMDVRPWGSMSSIIFHTYLRNRVPIRKDTARMLLCAILSDTLNLRSGTTTPADRFCVALLSSFGEVDDVDSLAHDLFTAKTNWIVGLGAYEMVRGDQKNFTVDKVRMSIAVCEVTVTEPVYELAEDLLTQLRIFKYEKGDYIDEETGEKEHDPNKEVHVALLFVVDTINQKSAALVCGSREKWVLERAFPQGTFRAAVDDIRAPSTYITAEDTLCEVGALVSRKLDFLPRVTEAIQKESPPDWFYQTSADTKRLVSVMQSGMVKENVHTSVQVTWDKEVLKAAVFNDQSTMKVRRSQQQAEVKREEAKMAAMAKGEDPIAEEPELEEAAEAEEEKPQLFKSSTQKFEEDHGLKAEVQGNLFLQPEAGIDEKDEDLENIKHEDPEDEELIPKNSADVAHTVKMHIVLVPDNYYDKKNCLDDGRLKPKRGIPHVKASEFFAGLQEADDGWVHMATVNDWPAFQNLKLVSITQLTKGMLTSSVIRHWDHPAGKPRPAKPSAKSIKTKCRATVLAPYWTAKGWAEDAPGFMYWYSTQHAGVPRCLIGDRSLRLLAKDDVVTRDSTITKLHCFAHKYPVEEESWRDNLNIHAGVLCEWSHGLFTTVVELAWLDACGGYAGKANWVEDKLEPETVLYKTMCDGMKKPWDNSKSEIRVYDMDAKNAKEFMAFMHKYSNKATIPFNQQRFVDPEIYASSSLKLRHCDPETLAGYLLNYIDRLPAYGVPPGTTNQNCQTFAADFYGFMTGAKDACPYNRIALGTTYTQHMLTFLYKKM